MGVVNRTFSELISFTRASNATYFDSTGLLRQAASGTSRLDYNPSTLAVRGVLIEESRTNLFKYSEHFNDALWFKVNSSIRPDSITSPSGSVSADKLVDTASAISHYVQCTEIVTTTTSYVFSVFAKAGEKIYIELLMAQGTSPYTNHARSVFNLSSGTIESTALGTASITPVGNGWYRCVVIGTSSSTTEICRISLSNQTTPIYTGNGSDGAYIYGAQLEAGAFATSYIPSSVTFSGRTSNGTYFASDGLIRTASSGVSRTQYNPTNLAADPFLLLEESRTNSLAYSEYADNAAWGKTRCSVSSNAATAPNGSMSADKMVEDTATGTHILSINATGLTGGATYTQTIYAKAAGRTKIIVGGWDGTTGIDCLFNLSTGVVESVGAGTLASSIDSVGSDWYRCRVTRAIAAAATELSLVLYTHNGTSATYTGDGTSGVFIWGAQIELGAFPTSYIPSSVTFSNRTSSGTYFDSAGVLQTASSGASRTTYNPANVGAEPFLLLEESRTNSIRNNTMVGAVAGTPGTLPTNWTPYYTGTGVTSTIVGTGTENGISYIDIRLNGTPSLSGPYVFFLDGVTAAASVGQTWTISSYCKLQAGSLSNLNTRFSITEYNSSSGYLTEQNFALSPTGASLNTQRASAVRTLTSATVAFVAPAINFLLTASAAIDITLRIGMPQLEQGAYPTSVISTSSVAVTRAADTSSSTSATRSADTSTSATATRAADVVSINTLSPWYNASAGTLYAEFVQPNSIPSGVFPQIWALTDGTFNNRNMLFNYQSSGNKTNYTGSVSGVDQWSLDGASTVVSANTTTKAASAYQANNIGVSVQGATALTDASATIPTVATLYLGNTNGNVNFLNGYIRRITYYPRRLTNAELQALTT